jgi:hypothetical protein
MGFGGGAGVVTAGGGDAGGWVVGGAGGWVVGGAGGWVVGGTDGFADGLADGLTECVVAVGFGTEEWAAAAVLQPAVNAASSVSPAADRARGKDMDQPFSVHGFRQKCVMRTHCRHAHTCDTARHPGPVQPGHGAGMWDRSQRPAQTWSR